MKFVAIGCLGVSGLFLLCCFGGLGMIAVNKDLVKEAAVEAKRNDQQRQQKAEGGTGGNTTARTLFIDRTGRMAIDCRKYDQVQSFSEGLAGVKVGGTWGFIDKSGRLAIEPQYKTATSFSDGVACVTTDDKNLCIDKMGKVLFEAAFRSQGFSEGRAPMYYAGLFGLTDKSGRIIVQPRFALMGDFSSGRAYVLEKRGEDQLCGIIDRNGEFVLPLTTRYAIGNTGRPEEMGLSEGFIGYQDNTSGFCGYMDQDGRVVLPASKIQGDISGIGPFSEGLAAVKKGIGYEALNKVTIPPDDFLKAGYINKTGDVVIPHKFEYGDRFCDGRAVVQVSRDGKYGYLDKKGAVIIEPKYDSAGRSSGGIAPVRINDRWGVINDAGKYVVEPTFKFISEFSEGLAHAGAAGR